MNERKKWVVELIQSFKKNEKLLCDGVGLKKEAVKANLEDRGRFAKMASSVNYSVTWRGTIQKTYTLIAMEWGS